MDVLTHTLAGALIADALPFTKRLGPRAPLVAAIAAAAPDLDMLPALIANFPWKELSFHGLFDMSLVMRFHRAYTHSFFVTALASVPLGYLAWRWSCRKGGWPLWTVLILLALFSHIFLDLTNVWGVRAWLPFSDRRSALGILPLTDLFLLAVMAAVFVLNHVFRDSYGPPDPLRPLPEWRRKTTDLLNRVAGATQIGVAGLALIVGRTATGILTAESLRGWF